MPDTLFQPLGVGNRDIIKVEKFTVLRIYTVLKFYRLKRSNPNDPNLVLVGTFGGVDYLLKIGGTQFQPDLKTKRIEAISLIPREFILTRAEFHATRLFVLQNTLVNAEEVTEEQARAEELINIDSKFSFSELDEDDDFEMVFNKLRQQNHSKLNDQYFYDMLANQQIIDELMKANLSNSPSTAPKLTPKK